MNRNRNEHQFPYALLRIRSLKAQLANCGVIAALIACVMISISPILHPPHEQVPHASDAELVLAAAGSATDHDYIQGSTPADACSESENQSHESEPNESDCPTCICINKVRQAFVFTDSAPICLTFDDTPFYEMSLSDVSRPRLIDLTIVVGPRAPPQQSHI